MNNKIIINNAKNALSLYESLNEDKRDSYDYNHKKWHAVNVKRYDDHITDEQKENIIKKLNTPEDIKEELKNYIDEVSQNDQMYYDWLGFAGWDQLNYELADLEVITKGTKDGHESLKYIKVQEASKSYASQTYIYALGNSGGWACFEDIQEPYADELAGWIDDIEAKNIEFKDYKKDIEEATRETLEAVAEVEYIKKYIENFNSRLSWLDEVEYRAGKKLNELMDEKKARQNDTGRLKNEVLTEALKLESRLNEFEADQSLKNSINRNLSSIIKIIRKHK